MRVYTFKGSKCITLIKPSTFRQSHSDQGRSSPTQTVILDMIHDRPAQDLAGTCQKMTAVRINDMESLTNNTCVHGREFSPGCAACFGKFEDNCPFLFMSGGAGKDASKIYFFDAIIDDDWHKLAKLREPRFGHKMHCVDKCLYVVGGNCLIEMYDMKTDKVKSGRPMAVRACLSVKVRNFPSAVYKNTIYMFGGESDSGPVKCVQYYNTKRNIVAKIADLPYECHGGSAVVIGDAIYIATEQGILMRFDPTTGMASACLPQPIPRKQFAMIVRNGKLCILSGEGDSKQTYKYIPDCWFDPVTDTWTIGDIRLALPVLTSFVVEYPRPRAIAPLSGDPYSRLPHRCKKIKTCKL